MNRMLRKALLALAALIAGVFSVAAGADSQARVVRLSDVQGEVKIDRNLGQGYEKAFLNMPLTQGVKLQTTNDGRAEIEFEDGSIIHAAPHTILIFRALSLRSQGTRVSTVEVQEGKAYFNIAGRKDDEFTVGFARSTASLTQAAHFRVQVDDATASLAVFTGDVKLEGPAGDVTVGKKQTASFDLATDAAPELAKNIDTDPFDAWDKQEGDYHRRYSGSNAYNGMPAYGMSDLAYYGNFMNVPGYGMMWQPYFAGYGWDPFMDGAWMFYPGFGYTWVSAYPWGWLPYHYGGWTFVPGFGWFWNPGTTFVVFNPITPVIRPPVHYVPPRPPSPGGQGLVAVGRGPVSSTVGSLNLRDSAVVVHGANAGFGVPRGISNLSSMNRQFNREGAVSLPMATRTTTGGMRPSGAMGGARVPASAGAASASHAGSGTHSGGMSSGHASSASHSGSHH